MKKQQGTFSTIVESYRDLHEFFVEFTKHNKFSFIGSLPSTDSVSMKLPIEISHRDQLVCCLKGGISFRYFTDNEEKVYHLCEGEIIFIPESTVYQPLKVESEFEVMGLYCDNTKVSVYLYSSYDKIKQVRCIPFGNDSRMEDVINDNFRQLENQISHYNDEQATDCLINLIYLNTKLLLERKLHFDSAPMNRTIDNARELINLNSQQNIKLNDVAQSLDMHPAYLSSLLSGRLNQGFSELLKLQRLDNAYHLLTFSKLTIKDIAEICGFNSSQYFIRKFKEHFVLSPSQVRNKLNIETRTSTSNTFKEEEIADVTFTSSSSTDIEIGDSKDQTIYFLNFTKRPVELFIMDKQKPQTSLGVTSSGGKIRSLLQANTKVGAYDYKNNNHIATFEINNETKVAMIQK